MAKVINVHLRQWHEAQVSASEFYVGDGCVLFMDEKKLVAIAPLGELSFVAENEAEKAFVQPPPKRVKAEAMG